MRRDGRFGPWAKVVAVTAVIEAVVLLGAVFVGVSNLSCPEWGGCDLIGDDAMAVVVVACSVLLLASLAFLAAYAWIKDL